jgi:hypothetical protein
VLLFLRSGQCTNEVAKKYKSSYCEKKNTCRHLVSKLEGQRRRGRPRLREDNKEYNRNVKGSLWTGFNWLRIGTSDVLL